MILFKSCFFCVGSSILVAGLCYNCHTHQILLILVNAEFCFFVKLRVVILVYCYNYKNEINTCKALDTANLHTLQLKEFIYFIQCKPQF